MKTEVIAIFDIGKTNKKLLLFDKDLKIIEQIEENFIEISDDDNFPCDDIEQIERWILDSINRLLKSDKYQLKGVNFSTYGATLVYLDKNKKRITPLYNYLKPMPDDVLKGFYEQYEGKFEFCRSTASPSLGMLNSGLQILWLKKHKPQIFEKVSHILHFPQYLSFLLSNKILSELTSIGCHTALWDYDKSHYHKWLNEFKHLLSFPVANELTTEVTLAHQTFKTGIGIHDSSASLVPYLKAVTEEFILISTGTWCIFMNPFNDEPLTADELKNDCLCYMSTRQKQVKSSRIFMGHIHDTYVKQITKFFNVDPDTYKYVKFDYSIISSFENDKFFFKNRIHEKYSEKINLAVFHSFEIAYHRFMVDLTQMCAESMKLILAKNDKTNRVYITGGFARNEIFVLHLTSLFPDKTFYTSEIYNATALGAAMVVSDFFFNTRETPVDLGLKAVSLKNLAI